ncbi:MAG: GNAT family N-acetyltransferase [Oscillospiraceae bacterium]|nr:GNAT family N-acetyltransferase [Oscillospiraceae bacterium]
MSEISIKHAEEKDIPIIEDIYLDVVNWLDSANKSLWSKQRVSWRGLSKEFSLEDFYIAYIGDNPAGSVALPDYDPLIWADVKKGESLFVHKLAVKRFAAGQGISTALLEFAVEKCREKNIGTLRLDTDSRREKLMKMYEDFGFVCVDKRTIYIVEKTFDIARYVCDVV